MPRKNTLELTEGWPVPEPAHGRRSATAHPQDDLIGLQAKEIIDEVLAREGECGEQIRQGLQRHVAARPGRPALALLEHVLAIRRGSGPSSR